MHSQCAGPAPGCNRDGSFLRGNSASYSVLFRGFEYSGELNENVETIIIPRGHTSIPYDDDYSFVASVEIKYGCVRAELGVDFDVMTTGGGTPPPPDP